MPQKTTTQVDSAQDPASMLKDRNSFTLNFALAPIAAQSITNWEQLGCTGYNPALGRLEAIVNIKQATGYNGGLCSNSSREYVRFYVDFHDGAGFIDMGSTSFKVSDIPEVAPGVHPLSYMVSLSINDASHRKFIDCTQAVIPTMRAILSWNIDPTAATPGYIPHYGNFQNADIQLDRPLLKGIVLNAALSNAEKFAAAQVPAESQTTALTAVSAAEIYDVNTKAKVPDHRTFFSTVGSSLQTAMSFQKATAVFNIKDVAALKINTAALAGLLDNTKHNADITFEEVTCVGLNSEMDTLGAVVHIKKQAGYSGNLCQTGSTEYVAFWVDWGNDGTFESYIGTTSFKIHDIANIPAGGLYYNVALPLNVANKLKACSSPNIIRIRAVLSWEALPSTTNPNALNTWGNSIDARAQLRPGNPSGMHSIISHVGRADRLLIDPTQHLWNWNAASPGIGNNRSWGGQVDFHGIIDRNGFTGVVKFRLSWKPFGAPDSAYLPVSSQETFSLWKPFIDPLHPFNDTQTAVGGWYVYDANENLGVYDYADPHFLSHWDTHALGDGTYTIRFEYTDETATVVVGDTFSIILCNKPISINPTYGPAVNPAYDEDLVIDGGDCHSYTPGAPTINGHLRAVHPYFGQWTLTLEPSSHSHGTTPSPASRVYSSVGDGGDANAVWTLNTAPLDPCGYTVSLNVWTRVILNSSPGYYPYYGQKAVGFAKLP